MHLARIVIGVDLTKASIQAAAWAAQSFAPEADVVLLHCISPLLPQQKVACARQHAAGYLSYLASRIGTTRCTYHIEVGDPARCLADLAAQVDANLIAVGEHEDHPEREPALGSTAEQLVRCADLPVLLCADRRSGAPRSVLLPLESPDVESAVAGWTEALANRFHARVVLVHVQPPSNGHLTRHAFELARRVTNTTPWTHVAHDIPPERVLVDAVLGDEGDAVLAEAKRFDSDLVLLQPPTGETSADATEPVDRVLRSSECAVLVVPPLEHPPVQ